METSLFPMVPAFPEADRQTALTDFRAVSVYLKCITLRYVSFRFCLQLFYNFSETSYSLKIFGLSKLLWRILFSHICVYASGYGLEARNNRSVTEMSAGVTIMEWFYHFPKGGFLDCWYAHLSIYVSLLVCPSVYLSLVLVLRHCPHVHILSEMGSLITLWLFPIG